MITLCGWQTYGVRISNTMLEPEPESGETTTLDNADSSDDYDGEVTSTAYADSNSSPEAESHEQQGDYSQRRRDRNHGGQSKDIGGRGKDDKQRRSKSDTKSDSNPGTFWDKLFGKHGTTFQVKLFPL